MRRPIGTGQRITLEATFIPSENLKNLLERYPVLATKERPPTASLFAV